MLRGQEKTKLVNKVTREDIRYRVLLNLWNTNAQSVNCIKFLILYSVKFSRVYILENGGF